MKIYSFGNEQCVITGKENNKDLFIRKTIFLKGYLENDYHVHLNSYEFYIVLRGKIEFGNKNKELVRASGDSIVYFEKNEPHKIVSVDENVEMLLIKKLGALKAKA